jgi:hypothetical protein
MEDIQRCAHSREVSWNRNWFCRPVSRWLVIVFPVWDWANFIGFRRKRYARDGVDLGKNFLGEVICLKPPKAKSFEFMKEFCGQVTYQLQGSSQGLLERLHLVGIQVAEGEFGELDPDFRCIVCKAEVITFSLYCGEGIGNEVEPVLQGRDAGL